MKKIICEKCGVRRGRRQCSRSKNKYICGECCSSMQLGSGCPENCMHLGKLNHKDINIKINDLIHTGVEILHDNPLEALRIFDEALKIDKNNYMSLIEKSNAYNQLEKYEESVQCLKNAAMISEDNNIYYKIASVYKRAGKFQECINTIISCEKNLNGWECDYLLGECYFMTGQFEKAGESMNKVLADNKADKENTNKAKIMLAKIYLTLRDIDKMMEVAKTIDNDYEEERKKLIENGYFASGRMYELLNLINSMEQIGYGEKFMLLQCSLVLKKINQGGIIKIIDDILNSNYCEQNPYEVTRLIGLQIKLLFKELKMKQAYEIFENHQESIIDAAKDVQDCFEACHFIAFFLYNLDKNKSISIYSNITGMAIDEFIIDELYNAFTTMDITPFVRAKAIEKSLELMRTGRSQNFNRTGIVADILYEFGEYSQAFDLYKRIDNEKPDAIILYKMAICLVKQNKFEEALETFINISALTKFIPGVYPGIIKCCLETNREWTEFFKSLELEKMSFSEIYDLAGSLMSKEYYDKAGYLYNYIMEKYKNMDIYSRKMIYHNMVCVYRSLKEFSKGIDLLKEVPQKYFGGDLLIDLGSLYFDVGDYDKSKETFESAIDIYDNSVVYFNLGILSMSIGDYEKALEYFNMSIDRTINEIRKKKAFVAREYGNMLIKLYNNSSLSLFKLGRTGEALLAIEKSATIERNPRVLEILSIVQHRLLENDKNINSEIDDINMLIDNCMTVKESFTEDIRRLLDEILNKVYGKHESKIRIANDFSDNIAAFIRNEKRIYKKYMESIERSEGTFQRYVENLVSSFDKKVVMEGWKEAAVTVCQGEVQLDVVEYSKALMDFGDELFRSFEYAQSEEYIYASLIPYYKIIKLLSSSIIYPYYHENIGNLPVPDNMEGFKNIGVYSYKAGGDTSYRMDFSFNISCSEYLFEINCHPGLRSEYLNYERHYMPWDKLLWMISGIKKKWDVIDDAKSMGLLLLFYCGYKNYLGIEGSFNNVDEIINLAGNLIHINNERDYYIRNMLQGNYEFDYLNCVKNVREIARKCMEGLLKIKRIE